MIPHNARISSRGNLLSDPDELHTAKYTCHMAAQAPLLCEWILPPQDSLTSLWRREPEQTTR